MNGILNPHLAIDRVMNAVAAGTSDQNGSSVDMAGYEGVMFIAALGTLTASQVTTIKAQVSSDDGSSDAFADVADSQSAVMDDADDNKLLVLDVFRPAERYVRPVLERGTANAVIDGIIAIRYSGKDKPAINGSTVASVTNVISKAEGTA